jgi:hypothetical protein
MTHNTKGAGSHHFFTNTNVEQFRILHRASANDRVTLTGGQNGTNVPTLSVDGSANIGLTIASKGTGTLKLDPATGDIQWGKALVALGGGAAATLGTIGGSGPATAAQNTWMRVLDSAGAAFWVPAWK